MILALGCRFIRRNASLKDHRDKLKAEIVWNIEECLKLTAAELASAEAERSLLRLHVLHFFEEWDVLITLSAPIDPRYPT